MIIRIPLDARNSRVNYRFNSLEEVAPLTDHSTDYTSQAASSLSDRSAQTTDQNSSAASTETAAPAADLPGLAGLSYSLTPVIMSAYSSSRYAFGVKDINISVPDADKPLVSSWFGNAGATAAVAGDTLVRRMTDAVIGSIETYHADALRSGLFVSPFRLGCALRTTDGKLVEARTPLLCVPNAQAPVMAIRDARPVGDQLLTLTEIRNHTCRLSVSLPPFSVPAAYAGKIKDVVFYVTKPADMLAGDEKVSTVRTYVVDGSNCRGWYYSRLSAETITEHALRDDTFRIIGSVAIDKATGGITDYLIPDNSKDLHDFGTFPKAEELPDPTISPDRPINPTEPYHPFLPELLNPQGVEVTTTALDLGMPERDKRVRSVTARGVFSRHPDSVRITLYGAHHRPGDQLELLPGMKAPADAGLWKKIASARGPHIRLLRGVRYRWLRVEIEAPYPARIDALTFLISSAATKN